MARVAVSPVLPRTQKTTAVVSMTCDRYSSTTTPDIVAVAISPVLQRIQKTTAVVSMTCDKSSTTTPDTAAVAVSPALQRTQKTTAVVSMTCDRVTLNPRCWYVSLYCWFYRGFRRLPL